MSADQLWSRAARILALTVAAVAPLTLAASDLESAVPPELTELRIESRAEPRALEIWGQRLAYESGQEVQTCRARSAVPEDCDSAWRPAVERVFEEWRDLIPGDPVPEVGRLRFLPGERSGTLLDALASLEQRFPNHPEVVAAITTELRREGRTGEATERIAHLVAEHPNLPRAQRLAAEWYEVLDNKTRAKIHLEAWLRLEPANPEAVSVWFRLHPTPEPLPSFFESGIRQLAQAPPETAAAVEACSTLTVVWDRLLATTGLACLERLADAERTQVASRSRAPLYREALRVADATAFDRWGSGLSARDRVPQVVAGLAGIRDCEIRVQKLRQHALADALTSGQTGLVVSSLYSCTKHPAAASLALELLAMAPPEELATVFHALSIRVVGRVPDYTAPLGQVVAVLAKRQAETPEDPTLFNLLDQAYEDSGADEQRITLLRSRLERGGAGLDSTQWRNLAELLLAAGRTEEAFSWLAQAPTGSSDLEQLRSEALLSLGRVTEVREHAEALIEDTENAPFRALGLELLAAVRAQEGDLPAALASLEGSVATGVASPMAKAIHYTQLLEEGDDGAVVSALTAECMRTVVEARGITLCVAARLADLGAFDRLRELLEPFVSSPVADLEQLEVAARLSRTAGFSDLARALLDRLLRLDSSSPERWQALAAFLREEGDLETLADLAAEAERLVPVAAFAIRWQLAKGYLAARRSREAVALLLSLREQTPRPEWIDEDLRHAYRQLGEEP